jgi:hypothetical protein
VVVDTQASYIGQTPRASGQLTMAGESMNGAQQLAQMNGSGMFLVIISQNCKLLTAM